MGRTKRQRRRAKHTSSPLHPLADCTPNIISLKQWMKRLGWKSISHLKLQHFPTSGRGLLSTKKLFPGDRLVEIPYKLLVTCATIAKSDLFPLLRHRKLQTQDLLALFLAWERRKGDNSTWRCYLQTLPEVLPPVPWLCKEDELDLLPWDFRNEVERRRRNFKKSWDRVGTIVTPKEFTWGYVMVNTRAVYVDPDIIPSSACTSDRPCMALCPYLDMFNHSHSATTSASLVYEDNSWKYVLRTSNRFDEYEEVFISYGAHDNIALLCEYGFFIPGNPLDTISFTLEEILAARDFQLSKKQFNFVKDRTENLYVSISGLSFDLKAVLYVVLNDGRSDWNEVVFCAGYSRADCELMHVFVDQLLRGKLETFVRETEQINGTQSKSVYLQNVLDYFKYRIDFVNRLLVLSQKK